MNHHLVVVTKSVINYEGRMTQLLKYCKVHPITGHEGLEGE